MIELLRQIHDDLTAVESTVATAESCTGGLIGAALSRLPGSSNFFVGGAITYSNEAKVDVLRISNELIGQFGAVSEEVAMAMAESARTLFDATYALSATGIAGPSGGSDNKPVGTIWCAAAGPSGTQTMHLKLEGNRDAIRDLTVESSLRGFLNLLRGRKFSAK